MSELIGRVDSNLRPVIRLRLAGTRRTFPVWIDLGFDADLVIPATEAGSLGVRMTPRRVGVTLGDGSERMMPLGELEVSLLRHRVHAGVLLSFDSNPAREEGTGTPLGLIGLGLLARTRITIDLVPQGMVTVETPIPRRSGRSR